MYDDGKLVAGISKALVTRTKIMNARTVQYQYFVERVSVVGS